MPYNVLCLVSTVIAMCIGAIHNLTTSQLVDSSVAKVCPMAGPSREPWLYFSSRTPIWEKPFTLLNRYLLLSKQSLQNSNQMNRKYSRKCNRKCNRKWRMKPMGLSDSAQILQKLNETIHMTKNVLNWFFYFFKIEIGSKIEIWFYICYWLNYHSSSLAPHRAWYS